MVPGELWDAQTPARRPHRRVWSLRCEVELHARRGGRESKESDRGGAVTVTTPAEAVGSSIGRLSHHRMMSGNVCDGLELVRRPHNGRESMRSALLSPSVWGGSAVVHSSKSGSQLVFELSERALSFRLTTSTPGMVTGIENRVRNDGSGPYQKYVT